MKDLVDILERNVKLWEEFSQVSKGSSSPAPMYRTLLEFQQAEPLKTVDFEAAIKVAPTQPLRNILKLAQNAFPQFLTFSSTETPTNLSTEQHLEELIQLCQEHSDTPEARLLGQKAVTWLEVIKLLEGSSKPPHLKISLSPSLDLESIEEQIKSNKADKKRAEYCLIDLPLTLTNTGDFPATDIKVSLKLSSQNSTTTGTFTPNSSDNHGKEYKLPNMITGGETLAHPIHFDSWPSGCNKIEIKVTYTSAFQPKDCPPASLTVEIPTPEIIPDKLKVKNPYIPDLPLSLGSELVKGGRKEKVDEFVDTLKQERRLLVLHGLKRTGKTSVIFNLEAKLKQPGYWPIYIAMDRWQRKLQSDSQQMDDENMLYELMVTAFLRAGADFEEDLDKFLGKFEKDERINYEEFKGYIEPLSKKLSNDKNETGHIIFFLDDLEALLVSGNFRNGQQFLNTMINLVQEKVCSFILAHEWGNPDWLEKEKPPLRYRTEFLKKEDVDLLARLASPLHYTEMALEYLWRVTGGWPGLVQLALFRLIESVQDEEQKIKVIDISQVKKTITDITSSQDNRLFIMYFMKSLTDAEIQLLRILEANLVDKKTSLITGIQKRPSKKEFSSSEFCLKHITDLHRLLTSLKDKQIIELTPQKNRWRLRVGLLAYSEVLNLSRSETATHIQKSMNLHIYLSSSLSLGEPEAGEEHYARAVNLPVALTNQGNFPVQILRLMFEVKGAKISEKPASHISELKEGKGWEIKDSIEIKPYQTYSILPIHLRHMRTGQIKIWAEYTDIHSLIEPKQTEPVEFALPMPTQVDKATFDQNPYWPDFPIVVRRSPESIQGKHRGTAKEIKSALDSNCHQIFIIRGLRQTGKTLILIELEQQLQERYRPIYITVSPVESLIQDTTGGLRNLVELMTLQIKEGSPGSEKLKNYLPTLQEKKSVDYKTFGEILCILQDLKEPDRIVFLLDGLDSWKNDELLRQNAEALCLQLSSLVNQKRCAAILALTGIREEWEREHMEAGFSPIYYRTIFFDRTEVEKLARLVNLPYTGTAIDYIWRVTGGWPALAQRLCNSLFIMIKDRVINGQDKILVDSDMVKKVVCNDILKNNFVEIMTESLETDELDLLNKFIKDDLIRPDSSQIDNSRQFSAEAAFTGLVAKQIIESVSLEHNIWRLRVGLFFYPEARHLNGNDAH